MVEVELVYGDGSVARIDRTTLDHLVRVGDRTIRCRSLDRRGPLDRSATGASDLGGVRRWTSSQRCSWRRIGWFHPLWCSTENRGTACDRHGCADGSVPELPVGPPGARSANASSCSGAGAADDLARRSRTRSTGATTCSTMTSSACFVRSRSSRAPSTVRPWRRWPRSSRRRGRPPRITRRQVVGADRSGRRDDPVPAPGDAGGLRRAVGRGTRRDGGRSRPAPRPLSGRHRSIRCRPDADDRLGGDRRRPLERVRGRRVGTGP